MDQNVSVRVTWGKFQDDHFHRLVHHSADVAACLEVLVSLPTIRARLERSAGTKLSSATLARLGALAFLHDAGKLHPGFQAKGWPLGLWKGALRGHVSEGAAIFAAHGPREIAARLCLDDLLKWGVDADLLYASFSHHGRPLKTDPTAGETTWGRVAGYDAVEAAAEMGTMMRRWFPAAFVSCQEALPNKPDFQHLFCGLVSLADWLGSDQRLFKFVASLDSDYMTKAREIARRAALEIGLDVSALQAKVVGRTAFKVLTGYEGPRPQQRQAAEYSLDERLIILEAETGSGKTEAALWRFARLFEARRVDSLYFALPTRAAAIQIHRRVNRAMSRFLG
ncbi:MAG: CRISPR-associated endonuclease Cas3'', partial [Xanthobacteraceae bacterium]